MNAQSVNAEVAVIGAAGQTGRPLVRALCRRGVRVRALVRRKEQASQMPEAVDVQIAELDDVSSVAAALAGAASAYYIPPAFNAGEERFGKNVIAAALAVKLPRLVYHSVMHSATPAMPHHQRKAMVELALRESPLTWTIVQPAMYAQTPLAFLNSDQTCISLGFDARKEFTPVDLEDLGEAVASILMEGGHEYATYELAGAERVSFRDMAAAMSHTLGREVAIHSLPSAVVAGVAVLNFGPRALFDVKAMLDHYDAHGFVGNANILRMLLGREPLPFVEVMKREFGRVIAAA